MRLYAYLGGVLAAIIGIWYYGHTRYNAADKASKDHYEAIIAKQGEALAAANQRAHDADVRADEITERTRQDAEKAILNIAAARNDALIELRKYQDRTRRLELSQVPGPTISPDVAARLAQCDRNDEEAINDAARAQSDAERLAQFQEWYRQQQAAHAAQ